MNPVSGTGPIGGNNLQLNKAHTSKVGMQSLNRFHAKNPLHSYSLASLHTVSLAQKDHTTDVALTRFSEMI